MICKEGPGNQAERCDVAKIEADKRQGAAGPPVNQSIGPRQRVKMKIGDATCQSTATSAALSGEAGQLKKFRRRDTNGVAMPESWLKEANQDSKQDWVSAEALRPECPRTMLFSDDAAIIASASAAIFEFGSPPDSIRCSTCIPGLALALFCSASQRGLREGKKQKTRRRSQRTGKRYAQQSQAPGVLASACEQRVRDRSDQGFRRQY